MDDSKNEAESPVTQTDTVTSASKQVSVQVPRYAVRSALHLAERSVDEINAKLRDAETERDDLARKLGAQQDIVDHLLGERDYRTMHARDLAASLS